MSQQSPIGGLRERQPSGRGLGNKEPGDTGRAGEPLMTPSLASRRMSPGPVHPGQETGTDRWINTAQPSVCWLAWLWPARWQAPASPWRPERRGVATPGAPRCRRPESTGAQALTPPRSPDWLPEMRQRGINRQTRCLPRRAIANTPKMRMLFCKL